MKPIDDLLEIMRTLRDPDKGCPWDQQQTIETILPHTLEEVAELVEAIEQNDIPAISDELGDILFHIVYYAQLAEEAGHFNFQTVTEGINAKLRRRHPHVFADSKIDTAEQQSIAWEQIKQRERQQRTNKNDVEVSLLDGISSKLPALIHAHKLQRRAATVGFDWVSIEPVLCKIEEEINELRQEIDNGADKAKVMDELGDLLFACVNFARHTEIDTELALRKTNRKFTERFKFIEQALAAKNKSLADASLDEMEILWQQAKAVSRQASSVKSEE